MSRASHLLKKFGITEEQYDELLRKQDSRCGVCRRHHSSFKTRLCVDHDHDTRFIRGLLCIHCNRYVVGKHRLGKGELLLLNAYKYLTAEYPGWIVPPKPRKKRHARRSPRKKKQVPRLNNSKWFRMVYFRCPCYVGCAVVHWNSLLSYSTILETYSLEDILELNDLTAEECLEFLVDEGYLDLPEIKPLDF